MKVMVFGSFDILHPGHLHFFKQAKQYGDFLYVVIARDKNIRTVKGKQPKNDEGKRLVNVSMLRVVDKALLGGENDQYKVIEKVKPDVICLGYDQKSFVDKLDAELEKRGLKSKVVRLKPYKEHQYKSSKLG